jgi:uncharacterized membrane protein
MSTENSTINRAEGKKNLVKITKIILIVGIILTSFFIIYEILNVEPGFVTLGVLNSEKKAENYPTEVSVGEEFTLFISVGNNLATNYTFSVHVFTGDQNTQVSKTTGSNGTLKEKLSSVTLQPGEEWISNAQKITFYSPGENSMVIFELWKIENSKETFYDVVFIRLNVT